MFKFNWEEKTIFFFFDLRADRAFTRGNVASNLGIVAWEKDRSKKYAINEPRSGSSNINTLVSKTFRDGRPRIDENPILIAEPRPAHAINQRSSIKPSNSHYRSIFKVIHDNLITNLKRYRDRVSKLSII